MHKVGLVMRKIQFAEAQGPRIYAARLQQISRELGVDIVFISPERHVSEHDWIAGYEHEKGDLVNYDIVLDQLERNHIDHVIYTVSGFTFLKMFISHCVLFPHSFPDPALTGYEMMKPFYSIVDQAIVQTQFLQDQLARHFGVTDSTVIPIGFEEQLTDKYYDSNLIIQNRVLWIGRDEENRRPDLVIAYAKNNPQVEVHMVFGGMRYKESMRKYPIPANVVLHFALGRDEIMQLMNTAKVYWCSSRFDTFNMPLTEAMAMGKLVVKPEHPCYGHIHGDHVFAGNPDNWHELVNMCLSSAHNVSLNNRLYAYDNFSTKVMKAGYRDFYAGWFE